MLVLFALVASAVGVVLARRQAAARGAAHHAGRLLHARSGDLPVTCSWCQGTTLGRKLLVFERGGAGWAPVDVMAVLARCPDPDVERVVRKLTADTPTTRRVCSDRCATAALGDAASGAVGPGVSAFGTAAAEAGARGQRAELVACEYCSVRALAALAHCPHCNAPRRSR